MRIYDNSERFKAVIESRIHHRLPHKWLLKQGIRQVYVAGNSLNRAEPHDIDLFPVREGDFDSIGENVVSKTRNAITCVTDGHAIQFCSYHHTSLASLVESFDFAHIQVGALVTIYGDTESGDAWVDVDAIYISEAWVESHSLETSWYTGSKYPLSSLVRLVKYAKYDTFPGRSYITSMLAILTDIVGRGYTGYDDFKDQLDAVDLGLLEEEYRGIDLRVLFSLLDKGEMSEKEKEVQEHVERLDDEEFRI